MVLKLSSTIPLTSIKLHFIPFVNTGNLIQTVQFPVFTLALSYDILGVSFEG